jgi:HEAT repeat protein
VRKHAADVLLRHIQADGAACQAVAAWIVADAPKVYKEAIPVHAALVTSEPALRQLQIKRLDAEDEEERSLAVKILGGLAVSDPVVRALLIARLADPVPEVRARVVQELGELVVSDTEIARTVSAMLTDHDPLVQVSAVRALAGRAEADPELVPVLGAGFASETWEVRAETVTALAGLAHSNVEVCAAVLERLGDTDWLVQKAAVEALSALVSSSAEVRAVFVAHLGDAEIGAQIVQALAEVVPYDREIRALFVASLNHPEQEMRKQAAEALAPLISSDPSLYARLLPAVGCAVFYGEDTGRHAPLLPRLASAYSQVIRVDPERRAEVISLLSDEDWRRRKVAAVILHEAGLEAVTEALPQLLAAVEDTRGYDSWPARLAAAERLLNTDRYGEEALNLAQEALTYDADALFPARDADEVRQQAALALGKLKALHRRADVAARIVGLLETEHEPEVLDGLFAALGSLAAAPEPME